MGARTNRAKTAVTSMRLSSDIMRKAKQKAEKLGLSRTQYIEQLVRRDLGKETVLDEQSTVFG